MSDINLAKLAEQFRAQRPAPPAPYSYPTLEAKSYKDMGFQIRESDPKVGGSVKTKTTIGKSGVIRSMSFTFSMGVLIRLGRNAAIEMSLLFSLNVGAPGAPAAPGKPRPFDHYPDYAFKVEIVGIMGDKPAAHFQKFDGFDLEVEAIEYKTGTDAHAHKRPGVPKYGNIKLSKGVIENKALWDWCMDVAKGDLKRRNITITVLDEARDKALKTFDFIGCWPTKWAGLRLDGKGSGALVEDLEFVVDYAVQS
jgi:phage tail-like protein